MYILKYTLAKFLQVYIAIFEEKVSQSFKKFLILCLYFLIFDIDSFENLKKLE